MRRALIGMFALLCTNQASATVVLTTLTGTIADAQGNIGASNPFGTIVTGQDTYTLVYTTDDGLPTASITSGLYGKSVTGAGTTTAAITIHGITRTIGGQTTAIAEHKNADPFSGQLYDRVTRMSRDFTQSTALYSDSYAETNISSYLSDYLSDGDYTTPFNYTMTSTDGYFSLVHFNFYDYTTNTQLVNVYLSLAPGTVSSLQLGGAVPEPVTWSMMITGFAMMGSGMRYRRRVAKIGLI